MSKNDEYGLRSQLLKRMTKGLRMRRQSSAPPVGSIDEKGTTKSPYVLQTILSKRVVTIFFVKE